MGERERWPWRPSRIDTEGPSQLELSNKGPKPLMLPRRKSWTEIKEKIHKAVAALMEATFGNQFDHCSGARQYKRRKVFFGKGGGGPNRAVEWTGQPARAATTTAR